MFCLLNQESRAVDFLIVGLGNPGTKYDATRHNAGFMAVDYLAAQLGVVVNTQKFHSLCARAIFNNTRLMLLKPQTFMNLSGTAVREVSTFYKIPPQNVILIFDDIALDFGRLRVRAKGSSGGHNGVKSVISELSSEAFPRVKIGVGAKPHPDMQLNDWVLSRLSASELSVLNNTFSDITDILKLIVNNDILTAMGNFNG